MVVAANNTALQAIIDEGLSGLYEAIQQIARSQLSLAFTIEGTHEHPICWYVSMRLGRREVAVWSSPTLYTERQGGLRLPDAWVQTCALPIRSEEHTSELQSPDH